jgi:ubiquinone biosynthesis protein UbiJ
MLNALRSLALPSVMERLTLLANHVLSAEPVAARRLQPHAGRCIVLQFEGWPSLLPALPPLVFRVTPAALLEWCGDDAAPSGTETADLRVSIEASNPALGLLQLLGGTRPRIDVAGDAVFAGDVNWLFENLRWDVQDDVARIVGQAPAHEIARVASAVAAAVRGAVGNVAGLAGRWRDSSAGQPPR